MPRDVDTREAVLLIVDDQEVNVHLLNRILQADGFQHVVSTCDPRQAAALYETHLPDLVLLDLNMPFMDGFAVMESLKNIPAALRPNILILTAQSETAIRVRALKEGARDFLSKPFDRQEVLSRIHNLLEIHLLQKMLRDQNEHLESVVDERTQQVKQTELEALHTLGRAAEFRDNETGMHVLRVGAYVRILAKAAGLDEAQQEMFELAAPMHDIGKIAISDNILLKEGKLTDEEFAIMKTHAEKGAEILANQSAPIMSLAREIALTHHEKWDGSGYPAGLKGEQIPLSGRMVALADVFDALSSERPYKQAWPLADIRQFLHAQRGKLFDPDLVQLFDEHWDEIVHIQQSMPDKLCMINTNTTE